MQTFRYQRFTLCIEKKDEHINQHEFNIEMTSNVDIIILKVIAFYSILFSPKRQK